MPLSAWPYWSQPSPAQGLSHVYSVVQSCRHSWSKGQEHPEDLSTDLLDLCPNPCFVWCNAEKEGDAAEQITQGHVGLGLCTPLEKAHAAASQKPYGSFVYCKEDIWLGAFAPTCVQSQLQHDWARWHSLKSLWGRGPGSAQHARMHALYSLLLPLQLTRTLTLLLGLTLYKVIQFMINLMRCFCKWQPAPPNCNYYNLF